MKIELQAKDFNSLMDWINLCKKLKVDITSTFITLKIETVTGEQK